MDMMPGSIISFNLDELRAYEIELELKRPAFPEGDGGRGTYIAPVIGWAVVLVPVRTDVAQELQPVFLDGDGQLQTVYSIRRIMERLNVLVAYSVRPRHSVRVPREGSPEPRGRS